jgi:hypothetical protein
MDDIVLDARREVEVLLNCWQMQGSSGGVFRNHIGEAPTSETSSECYSDDPGRRETSTDNQSNIRFVINDPVRNDIRGGDAMENAMNLTRPGSVKRTASSDEYFAAEEGSAGRFDTRKESIMSSGASPLRNMMPGSYDGTGDVDGKIIPSR